MRNAQIILLLCCNLKVSFGCLRPHLKVPKDLFSKTVCVYYILSNKVFFSIISFIITNRHSTYLHLIHLYSNLTILPSNSQPLCPLYEQKSIHTKNCYQIMLLIFDTSKPLIATKVSPLDCYTCK